MKNVNKIIEKFDWVLLNQYIEEGLIMSNKHKLYDLWILNYTAKTTYENTWNDYSMACRGLVIDADGNVIARPFIKFKNYEQHDPSEIDLDEEYEIYEKMDGSLGILFYYEVTKEWMLATRGSFQSDQAVEGMKILKDKNFNWDFLAKEYTYLWEIIYPSNRIVVNYNGLVDMSLLAIINTKTGGEVSHKAMTSVHGDYFSVVKKYELPKVNNLGDLRVHEISNKEGFVLKFKNGFRVKVKFIEYCRLHRIVTGITSVNIWESLMNSDSLDELINNVPDEFYKWIKSTISDLKSAYAVIEIEALKEFVRLYFVEHKTVKKDYALAVLGHKYQSILFNMFDNKSFDFSNERYAEIIWKMVKPERTFPFTIVE